MNLKNIKNYWDRRSKEFEIDLRATTNNPTIKRLEINAIYQAIQKVGGDKKKGIEILEIGCGNGHNCFALSELLPNIKFTGLDYSGEMIKNADKLKGRSPKYSKIKFYIGDVLNLDINKELEKKYDIIFTNRCLINLNSKELQISGIKQISKKLSPGGYFIMLENSVQNYKRQNEGRAILDLPRRKPAKFNLFIDENKIIPRVKKYLNLISVNDFASLYDVVLYILTPLVNNGVHDYNHPLVKAAADLTIGLSKSYENQFGSFGQNRLFLFRKK